MDDDNIIIEIDLDDLESDLVMLMGAKEEAINRTLNMPVVLPEDRQKLVDELSSCIFQRNMTIKNLCIKKWGSDYEVITRYLVLSPQIDTFNKKIRFVCSSQIITYFKDEMKQK